MSLLLGGLHFVVLILTVTTDDLEVGVANVTSAESRIALGRLNSQRSSSASAHAASSAANPTSGGPYGHNAYGYTLFRSENEVKETEVEDKTGEEVTKSESDDVLKSGLILPPHSGYEYYKSRPDLSQAEAISNANAQSLAQAYANSVSTSRLILPDEYIFPYLIPGENQFSCTREGELHYLQLLNYDCLVCVCLSNLMPVCASCSGCRANLPQPVPIPPLPVPITPLPVSIPPQPVPIPPLPVPTTPVPDFIIIPPVPQPPPVIPVSCSPLPSNVPFENPLNPCQVCVCKESFDILGKPDIQVTCEDNGQCVHPTTPTTIYPEPVPVPQPNPGPRPNPGPYAPIKPGGPCEGLPPNVIIPHPTDPCKLCQCVVDISIYGVPFQHVQCMTIPECIPSPQPSPFVPPDVVIVPTPSADITPVPLDVVPLPMRILPRPSPLPGPLPHESCKPFAPNVQFQHPWDECQVCVCTESFAYALVTIEVNCYTRPECCIIETPRSLPGGSSSASAEALANAVSNSGGYSSTGGLLPGGSVPGGYTPGGVVPGVSVPGASSSALAEAIAHAFTNSGGYPTGGLVPGGLVSGGYSPGGFSPSGFVPGSSSASAEAFANAVSNFGGYSTGGFLPGGLVPGGYTPGGVVPGVSVPGGSSSALVETLANAFANSGGYHTGGLLPGGYLPGGFAPSGLVPGGSSSASAEAIANAVANSGGYSPNGFTLSGLVPGGSSSASAEAIANAIANSAGYSPSSLLPSGYTPGSLVPGGMGSGGHSSASAEAIASASSGGQSSASANANAVSNQDNYGGYGSLIPGFNRYPGHAVGQSPFKSGRGLCKYVGDKYHHKCQACFCLQDPDGGILAHCLGSPCM